MRYFLISTDGRKPDPKTFDDMEITGMWSMTAGDICTIEGKDYIELETMPNGINLGQFSNIATRPSLKPRVFVLVENLDT